MLLLVKKKKLLNMVYNPIREEYKSIRNSESQENNDSDFLFSEYISRSVTYAYFHPHIALLNKQINILAEKWDKTLWKSRIALANGAFVPLIPKHSFLLEPQRKKHSASAKLYNKNSLPDHRLVSIRIRGISLQSLACIYHEMGHFIGFRKRQERLAWYFIPILVEKILIHVYEICCRSYIGGTKVYSNSISSYTRYSEDKEYNEEVRSYAQQLISFLQIINLDIQKCLDRVYFESSEQLFNTSSASNKRDEECLAISVKMGFFTSVNALMIRCLVEVLSQKDNHHRWRQMIVRSINGNKNDSFRLLWGQIEKALNSIVEELNTSIVNYSLPLWYKECEYYLEETAADIFMLKMAGFSCREYIDLIVRQLQNVVGTYSVESIKKAINKPAIHQRVISIAMVMNAQESDFDEPESQNVLDDEEAIYHRKIAKQRLLNMYKCATNLSKLSQPIHPDFFDPTKHLFKYVNELWHDKRYLDFCEEHQMLLNNILNCAQPKKRAKRNRDAWEMLRSNE